MLCYSFELSHVHGFFETTTFLLNYVRLILIKKNIYMNYGRIKNSFQISNLTAINGIFQ